MKRRSLNSGAVFAGGTVMGAVIAGGIAYAAIPATNTGNITACINKTTGTTRIIDRQAGRRCTRTESSISWNKGWRLRGTWSSAGAYAVGDLVQYAGSSYVAGFPSTHVVPGSSGVWTLLAVRGEPGAPGSPGASGSPGPVAPVNAWTALATQGPCLAAPATSRWCRCRQAPTS